MTRVFWRAASALGLLLPLACQAIANVNDVTYSESATATSDQCQAYCTLVNEACSGDLAVYEDYETCLGVCALLPAGNPDKPEGNTVACRAKQAEYASKTTEPIEKQAHCPKAGPGGSATCTTHAGVPDCEGYCTIFMGACRSISTKWPFNKVEECIRMCEAVPPAGDYSVALGEKQNDDMACRLNTVSKAVADPASYCSTSAGIRPAGECLGQGKPDCDDYCRVVATACTGDLEVYENHDQCEAVCALTPLGNREDSGGQDSVGCRVSHSYNALLIDEATHCPHSGPAGDGVCSQMDHPNCGPYCNLAASACPDDFGRHFRNEAACLDACEKLDDAAAGNAYSVTRAQNGNTLKCRTLSVARALESPDRADEFCPAAFGASPCF